MTSIDAAEEAKLVYGAVNIPVLRAIPITAQRILDVGCGTGALGKAIKERQPAAVTGLTYSRAEAELATKCLDRVVVCNLNELELGELGTYDCIICSHILEHLYWPDQFLKSVRSKLVLGGRLIVALPNVLAWRQRLRFATGSFVYTDGGLMDRTHFRFYDWKTARLLISGSGFKIIQAAGDGVFPLSRFLPLIGPGMNRLAVRLAPGLFSWQFVISAEPVSSLTTIGNLATDQTPTLSR